MKNRIGRLHGAASLVGLVLALAACATDMPRPDSTDGDMPSEPDPQPTDVVSLTIEPDAATATVRNGSAATQEFTVTAQRRDGSSFDATEAAGWTYSNGVVGSVVRGVFTALGTAGGTGTVVARLDGVSANATMTVFVEQVRVVGGAPMEAPTWYERASEDPRLAPSIAYPEDGTYFPPNLGDFEVHWRAAPGTDLFEVELASTYSTVTLYTRGDWQAFSVDEWELLRQSARGEVVSVQVRGMASGAPTTAGTGPALSTTLTQQDVVGGIYYWASTGAQSAGIYRHDMARPGQPAEPFYTRDQSIGGRCIGCHSVSRDGASMALTFDGGNGYATVLDIATRTPQLVLDGTYIWNFATFIPGSRDLVAVSRGRLTVLDAETGVVAGTVAAGPYATHPDFAPDASAIVYTEVASPTEDFIFRGGSIVTQEYDAATRTFSAARRIAAPGANNFYPSWSPDAQWILFNSSSDDSYDDDSAELYVVPADGSLPPRRLDSPNVGNGLTNSWARWAPFEQQFVHPDGTSEPFFWFTFSSKRPFGVRLNDEQPQVWMAPFFPDRARAGQDPSGPAFRLPFQELDTNNHIAQWTEKVIVVE